MKRRFLAEFEDLETQMAVQDLPEVPTIVVSEEQEQKLDLPDVPTKPPVLVDDAEISSAEVPTKRKSFGGTIASMIRENIYSNISVSCSCWPS
ncbi:hypothetical protein NC651_019042 [Populus alba x Populus x berolinensis]|nr:hypothetical protein NC651_019042 [Populus alba x Populus x berolinensis]